MNLNSLLKPEAPIELVPDLKGKMVAEIRDRYRNEISPELWKNYFDEEPNEKLNDAFLNATSAIVEETVRKHLPRLPDENVEYLNNLLWDESQSFWYEYAQQLKPILEFSDRLFRDAKRAVDGSFPKAEIAFGTMATSMLIDLEFQYAFYLYSKIAKPDLVDLRRMINIMGQIVEAIFFNRFFKRNLTLREIAEELESFTHVENKDRRAFLAKYKNTIVLTSKSFRAHLRTIQNKRNDYSHGWPKNANLTADFERCVEALISIPTGVLPTLYSVLKNLKGRAAAG